MPRPSFPTVQIASLVEGLVKQFAIAWAYKTFYAEQKSTPVQCELQGHAYVSTYLRNCAIKVAGKEWNLLFIAITLLHCFSSGDCERRQQTRLFQACRGGRELVKESGERESVSNMANSRSKVIACLPLWTATATTPPLSRWRMNAERPSLRACRAA